MSTDVEALNDRLATEHPIDDYYERSMWPIRFIERRRLEIIRTMIGHSRGLDIAEVGSGGGHVLRMFPDAKLTAIDVSSVFLETAKKNLRGYDVRFVKGELSHLSLLVDIHWIPTQNNIDTTTSHVRRDSHCTELSSLCNNLRFPFMIFRI